MGLLDSQRGKLIIDYLWFNYVEWSHATQWGYLSWHNVFYKSFIIYAAISILLVLHQLLHLILFHLLTCDPETRQDVGGCNNKVRELAHSEDV